MDTLERQFDLNSQKSPKNIKNYIHTQAQTKMREPNDNNSVQVTQKFVFNLRFSPNLFVHVGHIR